MGATKVMDYVLSVNQLCLQLRQAQSLTYPISDLSFKLALGQTLALVGAAGCGKSLTAYSILNLLPKNITVMPGAEISYARQSLLGLAKEARAPRQIGMIVQDPMTVLNPRLSIGQQLNLALAARADLSTTLQRKQAAIELLEQLGLAQPKQYLACLPSQLSDGLRQQVMLAMALAPQPSLLIADEPTSALDIAAQAQVMTVLRALQHAQQLSILLLTHDLTLAWQLADHIGVMVAGHIVESGPSAVFFKGPKHPYSQQLLKALPEHAELEQPLTSLATAIPKPKRLSDLCRFISCCPVAFKACDQQSLVTTTLPNAQQVKCHWYRPAYHAAQPATLRNFSLAGSSTAPLTHAPLSHDEVFAEQPILSISRLSVNYPLTQGLFKRVIGKVPILDKFSLQLYPRQILAIVGDLSNTTALVKAILARIPYQAGKVVLLGQDLAKVSRKTLKLLRLDLSFIVPPTLSSITSNMQVAQCLDQDLMALKLGLSQAQRAARIDELLQQVDLELTIKTYALAQLSKAQSQHFALARALINRPKLLVLAEPTRTLDGLAQAQWLNLLKRLQTQYAMTFLLISHNLGVVRYLADELAIMYLGRMVEQGPALTVLQQPKHPYTQALWAALPNAPTVAPQPLPHKVGIVKPSIGCSFAAHCSKVMPICRQYFPPEYTIAQNQAVACFLYLPHQATPSTSDEVQHID
jgi:peptide/nickel transport system ATP-binding protein